MRHFQEMNQVFFINYNINKIFYRNIQGSEKSIPALILTSSALDNILCICAATVLMAIQFADGDYNKCIIKWHQKIKRSL